MAKRNAAAGTSKPAKAAKTNNEAGAVSPPVTGAASPATEANPAAPAAAETDAPRARPEAGAEGQLSGDPAGPASTNQPEPPKTRAVLIVRAKQASRRRAGFEFTKQERVLNAADLTDAEILAIEADPMLVTRRDELPVE